MRSPMCSKSIPNNTECSIDGCVKPILRYGVCIMHYQRWKRHRSFADPRKTFEQRFWEKVDKSSNCWEWTGTISRLGYGSIRYHGKMVSAHRVAWEMSHGAIPSGAHVLHQCDNRKCVNPSHLFLGDHLDNMRDRDAKGRNGMAKLTAEQIVDIRHLYGSTNATQEMLGEKYGVSQQCISDIVRGRRWGRIENEAS